MKVKLTYEPNNSSWSNTVEKTVQDNVCESDIEAMFLIELGIPYNKYECSYEALDGKHIYTMSEVMAFTE